MNISHPFKVGKNTRRKPLGTINLSQCVVREAPEKDKALCFTVRHRQNLWV
jgi:hypothetical protein